MCLCVVLCVSLLFADPRSLSSSFRIERMKVGQHWRKVSSSLTSSGNAKPLSFPPFFTPLLLSQLAPLSHPFHIHKSRLTLSLTFDHVCRSFFSLSSLIASPRRSSILSSRQHPPTHSIPLVSLSLLPSSSSFAFFAYPFPLSFGKHLPLPTTSPAAEQEVFPCQQSQPDEANVRSDKKGKRDARLIHHPSPACHRIPIHHQGRPLLLREGTPTFSTAKTQQQAELNQATAIAQQMEPVHVSPPLRCDRLSPGPVDLLQPTQCLQDPLPSCRLSQLYPPPVLEGTLSRRSNIFAKVSRLDAGAVQGYGESTRLYRLWPGRVHQL